MASTNNVQCSYEEVKKIADSILAQAKGVQPKIGIICGSGLGTLASLVEDRTVIDYSTIPAFPVSTVPGHEGKLVLGKLGGKDVVLMKGRAHCYEGYPAQKTAIPVRVMNPYVTETGLRFTGQEPGTKTEIETVVGSAQVGDIMIIKDHVNLAGFSGINPLVGKNDDKFGERFPPMSNAYDRKLRQLAKDLAQEMGYGSFLREGVYSMMVGPNFETPTECRMLRLVGVDATGMSTIPEVLVARHAGMRVLGMSLITNKVVMEYDSEALANHEEVLAAGQARSKDLQALVARLMDKIEL
ncbi:purine nucleoside phosphorylase-like [Babylonia areolata]|uniref:purine nucleoside phosphorylase-like n=1 Tax=Babylonia areolata TaxID=304850 RepID=UPI003FD4D93C